MTVELSNETQSVLTDVDAAGQLQPTERDEAPENRAGTGQDVRAEAARTAEQTRERERTNTCDEHCEPYSDGRGPKHGGVHQGSSRRR